MLKFRYAKNLVMLKIRYAIVLSAYWWHSFIWPARRIAKKHFQQGAHSHFFRIFDSCMNVRATFQLCEVFLISAHSHFGNGDPKLGKTADGC